MKSAAVLFIGMAILMTACSPSAQAEPTQAGPTQSPTGTAATAAPPTATEATVSAAVSPTPGKCTDAAAFVADVTVPDYSHFDQRETFMKTWRVKNAGTCPWTAEYKAVYSRGDALGAPLSIPLSDTQPGATLDISTTMAAPARDGKFEIFYQLTDAAGDPMPIDEGDSLWALITVGKVTLYPPATPTSAPLTLASGSSSTSTGAGPATVSCGYTANADFVSQTLTLMNAARTAQGLPVLKANDQLNTAAASHSEDMACNNFLSHTGWNGSTPSSRIAAAGYTASFSQENIYGQPPQYGGTPQAAVDWWMSDPTHRDAILSAQAQEVGIGYAYYSRSSLQGYFTVDFAAP